MPESGSIRIVIPAHNRREITIRCLTHLRDLGVTKWAGIVVVDDGSTDGTPEQIASEFPEVDLLHGDGTLWWGGAIRRGMRHALGKQSESIFWLNDDCFPRPGTLELLLEISRARHAIVTAQTFTDLGILYGGRRKTWRGPEKMECPPGEILRCDFTTGNCVCFPAAVVAKTGLPRANRVPHQWADHDFGLIAREHGIECYVAGDAACDDAYVGGGNTMPAVYDSWLLSDRPITAVWKDLRNPKSALYLSARLAHFPRFWGLWGYALAFGPILKLSAVTVVRAVLPKKFLRSVYGRRSQAWRLQCLYGEGGKPGPTSAIEAKKVTHSA